jgi:hypothetical protein
MTFNPGSSSAIERTVGLFTPALTLTVLRTTGMSKALAALIKKRTFSSISAGVGSDRTALNISG